MTQIDPKVENPADRCETCNGTGFLPKMGSAGEEGPIDDAVDVCPTCDGTGSKSVH